MKKILIIFFISSLNLILCQNTFGNCLLKSDKFGALEVVKITKAMTLFDYSTFNQCFESLTSEKKEIVYKCSVYEPKFIHLAFMSSEASRLSQQLFGIKYTYKNVLFEQEIPIYEGNPRITVKLSSSIITTVSNKDKGYIQIQGGTIVKEGRFTTDISNSVNLNILDKIGFNVKDLSISLKNKFKTTISDGTVIVRCSNNKIEIGISFYKKSNYFTYEGSIIFTISPNEPPQNELAFEDSLRLVLGTGALVTAVLLIIKAAALAGGVLTANPVLILFGVAAPA